MMEPRCDPSYLTIANCGLFFKKKRTSHWCSTNKKTLEYIIALKKDFTLIYLVALIIIALKYIIFLNTALLTPGCPMGTSPIRLPLQHWNRMVETLKKHLCNIQSPCLQYQRACSCLEHVKHQDVGVKFSPQHRSFVSWNIDSKFLKIETKILQHHKFVGSGDCNTTYRCMNYKHTCSVCAE